VSDAASERASDAASDATLSSQAPAPPAGSA
jgi:hypothetical protein